MHLSLRAGPQGWPPCTRRKNLSCRAITHAPSSRAPAGIFARWLEYTQLKITRRAIIRCSRARIDSRLLGKVFAALHGGISASVTAKAPSGASAPSAAVHTDGSPLAGDDAGGVGFGGNLELRWATDLDRWITKVRAASRPITRARSLLVAMHPTLVVVAHPSYPCLAARFGGVPRATARSARSARSPCNDAPVCRSCGPRRCPDGFAERTAGRDGGSGD